MWSDIIAALFLDEGRALTFPLVGTLGWPYSWNEVDKSLAEVASRMKLVNIASGQIPLEG